MSSRAEKLAAARRKQEEEERLKAEAAEEAEKQRLADIKARRDAMKKSSAEARKDYEEFDGQIFCKFCGDLVEKGLYDDHLLTHPAEIRDRLYLGSAEHATSEAVLARIGATHVLNCTREIECPKAIAKKLTGFKRIKLTDRVADSISEHIKDALLWVDEALANKSHVVLIHCREGKSRSVSFLSAFLMWKTKTSFPAVLGMIRAKRSIAMPNPKFFRQLEELDKTLQVEASVEADMAVADMQFPPSKYKYKLKPPTGSTLTGALELPLSRGSAAAAAAASEPVTSAPDDDSKTEDAPVKKKKKKKGAAAEPSTTSGKKKKKGTSATAAEEPAPKKKKKKASATADSGSSSTAAKKKKKKKTGS